MSQPDPVKIREQLSSDAPFQDEEWSPEERAEAIAAYRPELALEFVRQLLKGIKDGVGTVVCCPFGSPDRRIPPDPSVHTASSEEVASDLETIRRRVTLSVADVADSNWAQFGKANKLWEQFLGKHARSCCSDEVPRTSLEALRDCTCLECIKTVDNELQKLADVYRAPILSKLPPRPRVMIEDLSTASRPGEQLALEQLDRWGAFVPVAEVARHLDVAKSTLRKSCTKSPLDRPERWRRFPILDQQPMSTSRGPRPTRGWQTTREFRHAFVECAVENALAYSQNRKP